MTWTRGCYPQPSSRARHLRSAEAGLRSKSSRPKAGSSHARGLAVIDAARLVELGGLGATCAKSERRVGIRPRRLQERVARSRTPRRESRIAPRGGRRRHSSFISSPEASSESPGSTRKTPSHANRETARRLPRARRARPFHASVSRDARLLRVNAIAPSSPRRPLPGRTCGGRSCRRWGSWRVAPSGCRRGRWRGRSTPESRTRRRGQTSPERAWR